MNKNQTKDKILNLIENTRDLKKLKPELDKYHAFELAEIVTELTPEKQTELLKIFSDYEIAQILVYMDAVDTSDILEDIDEKKAASIINEMEPDDATDILSEVEKAQAKVIINLLDDEVKEDIKELSKYDSDTAGSIMNTSYLKAYVNWDVKDAMKMVVKEAPEVEVLNTILVVNEKEELMGTLDLKRLIVTKSPKKIEEIMHSHFQSVNVNDKIEDVVKLIRDYDTYLMPVMDKGLVKGIITMDDAFNVLTDAVEEDYAKLAGLTEEIEGKDNFLVSIRKRLPWLIILLFLDLIVSLIISNFSMVIAAIPLLAFFQAAVLGLAGNAGTQSLAISVRLLSDKETNSNKKIAHHLLKEVIIGFFTGLLLGLISFGLVVAMLYLKKEEDIPPIKIAFVLSIAICLAVMVSNLFGSLIPIIFYKMKIDPAVASGPFITTINDIIVVVAYFGIASLMLSSYIG